MLEIGDKVAYSVQWLKSTGQEHTEIAHDRGVVKNITKFGDNNLIEVDWAGDSPRKVLECNLAKVGLNTKFSSC
jgi:hypothetical protein